MKIFRDGVEREHLATLALPLPLEFAGQLMSAIGEAAEAYGYTDVSVLADDNAKIIGTPPDRSAR